MRIEAYTQVQQAYQTRKMAKPGKTTAPSVSDQLQISQAGKDIQTAKQAISVSPDVREDLVAPIKEQIQKGTYHVTPESFAQKLLDAYQST
ncbi:MAG: flagellar biosynthesis anti-sigma factor FlgM [Clostridium sp.]|jgi:negative regulator of flagellin synthesis FlgM|nr:flagellar biosynthesis anti-sigma factor FlgM [Clostridium sp.]